MGVGAGRQLRGGGGAGRDGRRRLGGAQFALAREQPLAGSVGAGRDGMEIVENRKTVND